MKSLEISEILGIGSFTLLIIGAVIKYLRALSRYDLAQVFVERSDHETCMAKTCRQLDEIKEHVNSINLRLSLGDLDFKFNRIALTLVAGKLGIPTQELDTLRKNLGIKDD